MKQWIAERRKVIVSVAGTVAIGVQAALSDGAITGAEWGAVLSGLVTSVVLYVVPNEPPPAQTAPAQPAVPAPAHA